MAFGFLKSAAKAVGGLAGLAGGAQKPQAQGGIEDLMRRLAEQRAKRQQMLASPVGQVAQRINSTMDVMRGAGMNVGGEQQMSPFFQAAMSRMRQRSQQIDRGY